MCAPPSKALIYRVVLCPSVRGCGSAEVTWPFTTLVSRTLAPPSGVPKLARTCGLPGVYGSGVWPFASRGIGTDESVVWSGARLVPAIYLISKIGANISYAYFNINSSLVLDTMH